VAAQVFTLVSPVRVMVPRLTGVVQLLLMESATSRLTTAFEFEDAAKDLKGSANTVTNA
jgi:hypothetical protein